MKQTGCCYGKGWIVWAACCGLVLSVNAAWSRPERGAGWAEFRSAHFRIFTADDGSAATQALDFLERTHRALAESGLVRFEAKAPATIIAFQSEAEYAPYRPQAGVSALYQRTQNSDVIVLQSLAPENYPAAVHEYVHFVIAHSGLKLPLWLNEGLADVYSTIGFRESGFVIGQAPAGRLESLQGKMLPLDTLFAADRRSTFYTSGQSAYLFYAESWALAHMLMLDPAYSPRSSQFMARVSAGTPASACFETVYGKRLEDVAVDLLRHIGRRETRQLFPLAALGAQIVPERAPISEEQIEVMLANVMAANPARQSEAEERLMELSQRFPADPAPEEALGYLALRRKDSEQARVHFERAAGRNSKNPDVLYQAARFEQAAGAPDSQVIDLLERLLAIEPENESARLNLAVLAARKQDYSRALMALSAIRSVSTDDAFTYFYTLAYCQARLKRFEQARKQGRQALSLASSPDQQRQAENLLRYSELRADNSDVTARLTPAL